MSKILSPYEGNEAFVFVSYAHKDSAVVVPLIRGLQTRGVRVWYDAGLEVGAEWPVNIAEHLEKCCCVLAFVSRNFGDSHNCRREINFAIEERKEPVVIYLEPRENLNAGVRMQLGSLHAMFYDRYENADAFLDALLQAESLKPCMGSLDEEIIIEEIEPIPFSTIDFADENQTSQEETPEDWLRKAEKLTSEKRYDEAVVWYRKAAEQGNADAQYKLGLCYENGKGVRQDYTEAVKWYRIAVNRGNGMAELCLGLCYEGGRGVEWDERKAMDLFNRAKVKGVSDAVVAITLLQMMQDWFAIGKKFDVEKNYKQAFDWYYKAATQGYAPAQDRLGSRYELGLGTPLNNVEAVKWYRKAAEQGYVSAQGSLAGCYYFGRGVTADKSEAVRWARRAAEQGLARSQHLLGQCYEYGEGVDKDLRQALEWYRKAERNGLASAKEGIARCEVAMMNTQ